MSAQKVPRNGGEADQPGRLDADMLAKEMRAVLERGRDSVERMNASAIARAADRQTALGKAAQTMRREETLRSTAVDARDQARKDATEIESYGALHGQVLDALRRDVDRMLSCASTEVRLHLASRF